MYPYPEYPYYGVFVREQIEAISSHLSELEYKVYFIKGYKSKFEYLKSIFAINYLIWTWKPDIIHAHHGLSSLFLFLNPFAAKRTIVTLHGGDIQEEQGHITSVRLTKFFIKNVFFIFVLNNRMLNTVKKINSNVSILKCGIDIKLFKCSVKNNEKNGKLLIFPGNPERAVKNFNLFYDVYKKMKQEYPMLKLDYKVIHNLTREEVNQLLCSADCMYMTSISEGSPQIIKEAMSCNLPIVSVDVGDVKEILSDVENCYVTKTYDQEESIELLKKVLIGDRKRSNGRDRLIALGLGNDEIAKKIIEKYRQIVEKKLKTAILIFNKDI